MMKPNTALMAQAMSAAPKLNRSDAKTRGVLTTAQKRPKPSSALRRKVAESGISTISDR
jgi:hypothetical protein